MAPGVKRLTLGVLLILAACAVLLVSDLGARTRPGQRRQPRIAILQHASTEVLDDGVRGMIAALEEAGFVNGQTARIEKYNAEGDLSVANLIARQITSGGYDLVLTSSTPSMQAVANANKDGRVIHVFGLVANPYGAGIGLNPDDRNDHPRHLTGLGTFSKVKEAFEIAQRMLPGLKTVGVVWNAGESNSVAFTTKARAAAKELGLNLIEANIESSSGITEAANSLVSRGAQAFWVGGDNTVMMGLDALLQAARKNGVPVFSILPGRPDRGTLFDLGNDFVDIGRQTGAIAANILRGTDPATIPIRDVSMLGPPMLLINQRALEGLREPWRVPADLREQATVVVDDTGIHRK